MTAAEIVALRKALKCTQKDLAARVKVEVSLVQAWEAGAMFPTLKHTKMLEGIKRGEEEKRSHGGTEVRRSEEGEKGRGELATTDGWAEALGNAEFMAALRKALANPALQAEFVRAAARYKDPLNH